MLLAFVTILNIVLQDRPETRHDLFDGALGQVPVIGSQLAEPQPIGGSVVTVVVGLLAAIWSGMAAASALQTALDDIADVPPHERPNGLVKRLRSLAFLVVLALGISVSTLATNLAGLLDSGLAVDLIGLLVALLSNVGIFLFAFGGLSNNRQAWHQKLPGAIAAAVAVVVLLRLGTFVVERYIKGASDTYGTFAVVIALLSWFYLVSRVILLGAELNGVLANELWPRSLVADSPLTEGDRRAAELDAGRTQRDKRVEIEVTPAADDDNDHEPERPSALT